MRGHDRFWMELDSVHQRASDLESHDFAVIRFREYFDVLRKTFARNDKRVVSRCAEHLRDVLEERVRSVLDAGHLAMNDLAPSNDRSTLDVSDRLMTETHSEHGPSVSSLGDHIEAPIRIPRMAGTRGDDVPVCTSEQTVQSGRVVPFHGDRSPHLSEILGDVENK